MPLECVFRRVSLTLWRKGRVCAAESFAFARRMGFFLSKGGRTFESLLAESKTPESYTRNVRGERVRDGG